MRNTVVIKGRGIQKEAQASAAITPGHLVELAPTGLRVHSTAAGNATPTFAKELEVFGRGIDADYAADDTVIYEAFPTGAEVYALVAASAAAIVVGDYLESAGDGTLRKTTTASATANTSRAGIVARAMEAVDNSAGATPARIIVEVL